jgi:stage II sporulation protein D
VWTALLSAWVLAAPPAPVRVRVLERLHPSHVSVWLGRGARARCDGAPLPEARLELVADGAQVRAGERACGRVVLEAGEGALGLECDGLQARRHYPGTLQVDAARGELGLINELDLEAYVAGVVDREALGTEPASLQAQAVVSRSFAASERGRHGDVDFCDLAHCQVYQGRPARPTSAEAATKTAGMVLHDHLAPIHAHFHSACGGRTASATAVLGEPPLASTEGASDLDPSGEPWCRSSPFLAWERRLDRAALAGAVHGPRLDDGVHVLQSDRAGYVLKLRAYGVVLSGEQLKRRVGPKLGWQAVPSTRFTAEGRGEAVLLRGAGLGHGVGLCQYGARARAQAGQSLQQIIEAYFPGATLGPVGP